MNCFENMPLRNEITFCLLFAGVKRKIAEAWSTKSREKLVCLVNAKLTEKRHSVRLLICES